MATSPTKVELYRFHPLVLVLAFFLSLLAQSYLPLYFSIIGLLDLPLLVVIYFGLTRRKPVESLLSGAVIGMAQDSLSGGPIGLLGAAKTVIGFVTTSISVRFAVENHLVRFVTVFFLYQLHLLLVYLISAGILGQKIDLTWQMRALAGLVNALAGVLVFQLLDRFRKPA